MSCIACKTNKPCALHRQVCNCIRADCWHAKGMCDEPPKKMYGSCSTCLAYNPKRCPTCKQVIPDDDEE